MPAAAALDPIAERESQRFGHAVVEVGGGVGALLAFVLGSLRRFNAIVEEMHVVLDTRDVAIVNLVGRH